MGFSLLHPPVGGPGSWQSPCVPEPHGIVQQLLSASAEAGSHPRNAHEASTEQHTTRRTAETQPRMPRIYYPSGTNKGGPLDLRYAQSLEELEVHISLELRGDCQSDE